MIALACCVASNVQMVQYDICVSYRLQGMRIEIIQIWCVRACCRTNEKLYFGFPFWVVSDGFEVYGDIFGPFRDCCKV